MCSVDQMLLQLKNNRKTVSRQIDLIAEVMEKSNNVLLQMETERGKVCTVELPNMKICKYNKETEQTLSKTLEIFQQIQHLAQAEENSGDLGFTEYLLQNCQNIQYLSSNARKLLAIDEIMNKATEKNITDQHQTSGYDNMEETVYLASK